jgi:alkylation response protein AidB-like acyl-CoA dehydrogenase
MSVSMTSGAAETARTDWVGLANELGSRFAARITHHDAEDAFVHQNYAELKARRVFSAGVPAELGGGGASIPELCALLRTLARHCPSTALALSMHTHNVAAATWRWRHESAPVEAMLRRIAAEELILVSSGGSDWLAGSGVAERVDGGYRVTARKVFSSGSPGGDLLMTSAVYEDPEAGPTVLHFPVPLHAEGVRILDTWHTLGMRGTGSNDVRFDGVFVPEKAVGVRRAQGKWHPLFHLISMVALPLIYSVYVGIAEAARDFAVQEARGKREDPNLAYLVGEMENELATARMAIQHMIDTASRETPGPAATGTVVVGRTLVGRAAIRTVEKAMEVAGGRAFYRSCPIERLFRDVQGARYHPLQEKAQLRYTGRLALGLDIDG